MDWLVTAEKHLKSVYYHVLCTLSWVVHSQWIIDQLPAEKFAISTEETTKRQYQSERALYRLVVSLMRDGVLIPEKSYYLHKQVAQKYNWPYIKESYDNS